MARRKMTGLMVNGSVRTAGVTFYTKQGKTIIRTSRSMQPKRRTRAQFDVRMRTKHTIALWQMMKMSDVTRFHGGNSAYARFASLAFRLPVVYIPCRGPLDGASLLMPDLPVSDGTLPSLKQQLGEYNGTAALLTNLKPRDLQHDEELWLYTAEQRIEGRTPRVRFKVRVVPQNEFTIVEGCLALVAESFADEQKGWALVRVYRDRCSSQTMVTRCTYYQQFTTEEALQEAAKSYGGLTE